MRSTLYGQKETIYHFCCTLFRVLFDTANKHWIHIFKLQYNALYCCVSCFWQRESAICTHKSPPSWASFFPPSHSSRSSQGTKLSSLSCIAQGSSLPSPGGRFLQRISSTYPLSPSLLCLLRWQPGLHHQCRLGSPILTLGVGQKISIHGYFSLATNFCFDLLCF